MILATLATKTRNLGKMFLAFDLKGSSLELEYYN